MVSLQAAVVGVVVCHLRVVMVAREVFPITARVTAASLVCMNLESLVHRSFLRELHAT